MKFHPSIPRKIIASLLGLAFLLAGACSPAQALSPQQRVVLFSGKRFVGIIDQLGVTPAADFSVRCLAAAWQGKHVVNIRRASDSTATDINCLSGTGNFDTASFNTFCAATTCFVTKWYDQSGNGRDASQSTAASQPQLTLNTIGGKPALVYGGSQALSTPSFASATAAETMIAVAKRTSNFTTQQNLVQSGTQNAIFWTSSANTIAVFGSATLSATAADSVAHSLIGVINGASSVMTADGADTTGNAGSNAQSAALNIGGPVSSISASVSEVILLTGAALSSAQRGIVTTGARSYFGTP